jgi:hypothetical protein
MELLRDTGEWQCLYPSATGAVLTLRIFLYFEAMHKCLELEVGFQTQTGMGQLCGCMELLPLENRRFYHW